MTSPFSGNRKKDRLGRSGLKMTVCNKSKNRESDDVSVEDIKNTLVGSKIFHMCFDDDRMEIYVETPKGVVYIIYFGAEVEYIENGWYIEWICELLKGDNEWQDDQREWIKASVEYMEHRRMRYPND